MMRKFTGDDDYDEDMDERDYDDDNRFEGYFNSRYSFNDPPVMSRRAQTDEERWRGRRPRRMRSQFARRKFPPMFPPGFRPFFVPYPMPVYY
ncbi:hypothetical protein RUM43_002965 [Polyplax serrata]|uniref:Uncharacterized protein n=1 Tax=Polyplax serrata TaxID=468196 RepID=A0AAN8Q059_POLSC